MTRTVLFLICLACPLLRAAEPTPVSFRRDVAPLLLNKCQGCHGPDKIKGSYRLDTFENLIHPGESDAAPLVPGRADKSELYRLITTTEEADRMPKKGERLSDEQVQLLKRWIDQGAKFDGPAPTATLASLTADREQPAPPPAYRQPIPITALAFSPDGSLLAASGYHEVTLWDPSTGQLVGRIPRTAERVFALDFFPDCHRLALAGGEPGTRGEVRLCDVAERKPGKVLDTIADAVLCVRFSPDGHTLAAGGADNIIRLYDATTGRRLRTIEQHADWVTDLAFSPDGSQLASASRDKSCRVFDAKTGAMLSAYLNHEEAVYSVAWSADGHTLFSSGRDRRIHAWSAASTEPKPLGQIAGFKSDPLKLALTGDTLFACTADGSLRAYDATKRELRREFTPSGGGAWLYTLCVNPSHHRLATGGDGGAITVWDTKTGKVIQKWIAAPGYHVNAER